MPEYERGPCQAAKENGDLCGVERSSCWYGAARKGIHFCARHRSAWNAFEAGRRERGTVPALPLPLQKQKRRPCCTRLITSLARGTASLAG